jgi:curved DNA-binding protein CbpA
VKDHYETLELPADASSEDVKRAFRMQIARYHPDKVHHLGKEFQELAQTRAAELTAAYSTLSDRARRAEYDRDRRVSAAAAPANTTGAPIPVPEPVTPPPSRPMPEQPEAPEGTAGDRAKGEAKGEGKGETRRSADFAQDQASRDELVRRASIGRLREACKGAMGKFETVPASGFDLSCSEKGGLFARLKDRPWVLGRYMSSLDPDSLRRAGEAAARLEGNGTTTRCVFLLSGRPGRAIDLDDAINDARRRAKLRAKCTMLMIPVDVRTWEAYLPKDAPALARAIVAKLKEGSR